MPKPHKLIAALLFFALALSSFALADDSVTITTYYPAPYGVYNEMQLYPHSEPVTNPCDNAAKGTMYYDTDDGQVKVCDGAGKWPSVGGACSDVPGADQSNCWKDVDSDGYSSRTGDCNETCNTCYAGSTASTFAPDGKDQNCNGLFDELYPAINKTCLVGSCMFAGDVGFVTKVTLQSACNAFCGTTGILTCTDERSGTIDDFCDDFSFSTCSVSNSTGGGGFTTYCWGNTTCACPQMRR